LTYEKLKCRGGGNGRHTGLRNRSLKSMRVRLSPTVQIVKWRNGKRCVCSIRHQYEAMKILHVGLRKLVTGSNPVLTTENG
jgi:hypothetical protein